jgi:hypothetical protein
MGCSFVLPLVIWAACSQTQITPTDRAPFSAQVLAISATAVELAEGSKLSQIATDKLRRLEFSGSLAPSGSNTVNSVAAGASSIAKQATLVDGTTFQFSQIELNAGTAEFQLASGLRISVPATQLHSAQFQQLNEAQWTQWQAITKSRTSSDLLVLIRSSEALEKLEGVISKISADSVSFDFGGQNIDAPLAKLAGASFFTSPSTAANSSTATPRENEHPSGKLIAIVVDRSANRWLAANIDLARGSSNLEVRLQCGLPVTLPLEQLREIDFSTGNMQFLAELEPLVRESTGRFQLGVEIAGAASLFGARVSEQRQRGALALGPSLEFLGSGAVEYRVPADFTRLAGAFELRPTGSRFTPCRVTVKLENEVLWQESLSEVGKLRQMDIKIEPDRRLRIEVQADSSTPVGDVVLCHDLRFIK